MKIGLIRCMQTEDMCPATRCLKVIKGKADAFSDLKGDPEIVGVSTCGGCPGKRAVTRAALMVKRGAEAIAFSSCITTGSPVGIPCPHQEQMIRAVQDKVGSDITVLRYTHK